MMQTVVLVAVITTQTINNSKCSNQSNKNELWCKASFQPCCVEVESKKGSKFSPQNKPKNMFFRIDLLYMYRKNSHIWVTTQNFIIIRWENESGYPCPHSYWLNPHSVDCFPVLLFITQFSLIRTIKPLLACSIFLLTSYPMIPTVYCPTILTIWTNYNDGPKQPCFRLVNCCRLSRIMRRKTSHHIPKHPQ